MKPSRHPPGWVCRVLSNEVPVACAPDPSIQRRHVAAASDLRVRCGRLMFTLVYSLLPAVALMG